MVATAGEIQNELASDRRGQISWALVEFARSPYVGLVFMFVFAPYFATAVVGDAIRGQELWSLSYTISGLWVALSAPFLGAVIDRMGPRKPWILATVIVMAPACWILWYAMPGAQGGLPLAAIIAVVVLLMIAFEYGAVAHNAMLPSIASGADIGRVSGLGLGIGAIGGMSALGVVLVAIVWPASPEMHFSFLPAQPLFGLDPERYEHARIVGPIAAIWMVIFIVPLLLWTPDRASTRVAPLHAAREGFRQLRATLGRARQISNVGLFLAARMLYYDATIAIQAYCGIYAAGVFGWDIATIMMFALSLSGFCILGGFVGGWLDGRVGSRRAILLSLAGTGAAILVAISVTPTQILFMPYDAVAAGPIWSLPYFRTLPEIIYVMMYMILAVTITAVIVNSRAMMARIAPLSMMSQFFGLYALSGTATTFVGHGMVALFTSLFQSQRAGIASLLIPLCAGSLLLLRVHERRAPEFVPG